MSIRTAEKCVADLPQVASALLVCPSFCDRAAYIEHVDDRIGIGPVIENRGQVNRFPSDDLIQDSLSDLQGRIGTQAIHMVPKPLEPRPLFDAFRRKRSRAAHDSKISQNVGKKSKVAFYSAKRSFSHSYPTDFTLFCFFRSKI